MQTYGRFTPMTSYFRLFLSVIRLDFFFNWRLFFRNSAAIFPMFSQFSICFNFRIFSKFSIFFGIFIFLEFSFFLQRFEFFLFWCFPILFIFLGFPKYFPLVSFFQRNAKGLCILWWTPNSLWVHRVHWTVFDIFHQNYRLLYNYSVAYEPRPMTQFQWIPHLNVIFSIGKKCFFIIA